MNLITMSFLFNSIIAIIGTMPTVKYGQIKIPDGAVCNFIINNEKINNSIIESKLVWGLIEYTCNNISGHLISKFECKDCGIYCAYNTLNKMCTNDTVPLILGIIITFLMACIIALIFKNKLNNLIHRIIDNIIYKYYLNKYKRNEKKKCKLEKMTGLMLQRAIKQPTLMSNWEFAKFKKEINKEETDEKKKIEEIKINEEMNEENYNIHDNNELKDNIDNTISSCVEVSLYPSITTIALIMIILIPIVTCCDRNLYINSKGLVCDKNKCQDLNVLSVPIHTGNIICFKDITNNLIKIKITNSYFRQNFNLMYYTSEYKLDVIDHSSCKGSGNCWNNACKLNTVSNRLKNINKNNSLSGYGCDSDTIGCDSWCYHQSSCTWYKWFIVPTGRKNPVYKYTSKIWEVELEILNGNRTYNFKLNVNNPSINLNNIMNKDDINIPFYITGLTSEDLYHENYIIKINENTYNLDSSNINFPETNKIGDIQLSIFGNEIIYNKENIRCQINSCRVVCLAPESKMSRLNKLILEGKYDDKKVKIFKESKYNIETITHSYALINAMIGNLNYKNLYVDTPSCDLNIIDTFSCIGCNSQPFIILQSSKIETEGLLKFESNCTFDKKYVSCNREPYILKLKKNYDNCYIYIKEINKTIEVNFNNIYLGGLDPINLIESKEEILDTIKTLTTDSSFITGVLSTLTTFSMLGLTSSIIIKIIKIITVKNVNKEINKNNI